MKIRQANINGKSGWCVDYGIRDGRRRREYFISKQAADKAFKRGEKDAAELGRRWTNLQPHERLGVAEILGEIHSAGLSLRDVWDGYRKGAQVTTTGRQTLRQAIDLLIESKTKGNKRPNYITNLRQDLDAWARGQEQRSLASITLDEIENYVNTKKSVGSRLTTINRISTLFSFAVRRGWIVANPCKRIERPTVEDKLPVILSDADTIKLLGYVQTKLPKMAAWISLALFGGLRPEEADKITWDKINLDAGTVLIDPSITKVRNARTVHLEPVAVAWLKLGGELPLKQGVRRRANSKLRDFMGWKEWPKDVLRHTCASHWIALKKSYGAVAIEMGNSENILRKHYRAEVAQADCKKFWSLTPKAVAKEAKL
jgi:integrase